MLRPHTGARAPVALAVVGLLLAAAPYAAGFLRAPRGTSFLGALNNVGDNGQYIAAIRQGMEGHLLYVDQYTSVRVAPILMYPLYTATGFALSPTGVTPMVALMLLHALGAVALLVALWRLCRLASPVAPRLAFAVCVFGGGLYLPTLLVSKLVPLPFAPEALTSPELAVFTTLLVSAHGAFGLAAELWALASYLRWRQTRSHGALAGVAFAGLAVGLCYPFGLPVLVVVVAIDTLAWLLWSREDARAPLIMRVRRNALIVPALLPAGCLALYYALLFRLNPVWGSSNMVRLPPLDPAVVLVAYGLLLALAVPALRLSYRDGTPAGRLLAIWAVVNGVLLLAPLPQSERLANGWSVVLGLLAALTLRRLSRRALTRWLVALGLSNVTLALLYIGVTVRAANPVYYIPRYEGAAATWLAGHCRSTDVVMASAGSGNNIVSAARCRVVAGQYFETFNWARVQHDIAHYYASTTSATERAAILRRYRVTLVLAGPYESALGRYVPSGTAYRLLYHAGAVRMYALTPRRSRP